MLEAVIPNSKTPIILEEYEINEFTDPDTEITYPIHMIGRKIFKKGNAELAIRNLKLGPNVISVGQAAFAYTAIKNVTWADNCNLISSRCFIGCELRNITNISHVKYIGKSAFKNCSKLKSFDWPSLPSEIKASTFDGCSSLETISNLDNIKSVGKMSFRGCTDLNRIELPLAEVIESEAFIGSGIYKVKLSNNLKEIGAYSFEDTKIKDLRIPSSVTTIGLRAFKNCYYLESVNWSPNCSVIKELTFANCPSLSSITGIENVEDIESAAFHYCGMVDFTFPEKVTVISPSLFEGCGKLRYVHNVENIKEIQGFAFSKSGIIEFVIPNCELTGTHIFYGCNELKKLCFTGNNISVPPYTCSSCTSLVELEGLNNIVRIGKGAFSAIAAKILDFTGGELELVEEDAFFDNGPSLEIKMPFDTVVLTNTPNSPSV